MNTLESRNVFLLYKIELFSYFAELLIYKTEKVFFVQYVNVQKNVIVDMIG